MLSLSPKFLMVLSVLGCASFVQAQEAQVFAPRPFVPYFTRSFVTLVPTVGAGASSLTVSGNTSSSSTNTATGYRGGMLVELGRNTFSFQTGLIYQREAGQISSDQASSTSGVTYTSVSQMGVDEIGVPLLMKLNLRGERMRRFTFKAGAIPFYAMNVTDDVSSSIGSGSYNGTAGLRSINALAEVGAGFEMTVGRANDMRFEVVYDHSVLPLNSSTGELQIYSQSVMLQIGFGLGT